MANWNLRKTTVPLLVATLLFSALVIGGCAKPTPSTLETIAPQEAFERIQENQADPDFVILDVRTPEEYAAGHIADAELLNFYAPTFAQDLDDLDKTKTYLVYCRTGNRSGKTLTIMASLDFERAYNVDGGITRWAAEGLPVVK
jgi:rhodanese-related sulfurtransferase